MSGCFFSLFSANFKRAVMNRVLRPFSTTVSTIFANRNPRNLEFMSIGYKPAGYFLEAPGNCFWYKLHLEKSTKWITASVEHFDNGVVVSASTKDWPIRKHLYRPCDVMAYKLLAQVLADRCLSVGLNRIQNFIEPKDSKKISIFLKTLEEEGVMLQELEQYRPPIDNDWRFLPKVWQDQ